VNEREVRKYLEYLGEEAQYPPNSVGAGLISRQGLGRAAVVLVALFLIGSVSGLMYHGVRHTITDVGQTTRNISENIPIPTPSVATLASAENSNEVWWVVISIGICTTPAMPQVEPQAVT
jgi:hypothetical protein